MVTLDTSASSLRTTYATLTSRPSHLADYLRTLARSAHERSKSSFRDTLVEQDEEYDDNDEDDGHRLSAPNTPFASLFAAHLASAGLLPQSAGMIHLFLDRPSAPYTHILTYLRSPPSATPTLPRAASLGPRTPHAPERLEALLELRDEAKYLGLDELHKLCCDELRQRQGHVRGGTGAGLNTSTSTAGSGNQQTLLMSDERGRGRDTCRVNLGGAAYTRREVQQPAFPREEGGGDGASALERNSTGSVAASEVAHVEGAPLRVSTPAPALISAPMRAPTPGPTTVQLPGSPPSLSRAVSPVAQSIIARPRSRSRSRNAPRSATDWI
ncbi:hypothetical protein K439DRAFT_904102 [Ramaria rubella]|nr:hypothetical protein K439DRAFT_904102 [Ramaria rubella]